MRGQLAAAVVALVLAATAACADDAAPPRDARAAIATAHLEYSEAVKHHDASAVTAFYTPDCILLPPDQVMLRGHEMVTAFWTSAFAAGLRAMVFTVVDLTEYPDAVIETGRVGITTEAQGKTVDSTGKYLAVWRKHPDGGWRLHRHMWNANRPAAR